MKAAILIMAFLTCSCGAKKKAARMQANLLRTTVSSVGVDAKIATEIRGYGDTLRVQTYLPATDTTATIKGESTGISYRAKLVARKDRTGELKGYDMQVEAVAKPVLKLNQSRQKHVRSSAGSTESQTLAAEEMSERKSISLPWWIYLLIAGGVAYIIFRIVKFLKPF